MTIRIFIVDDHPVVRKGISGLLGEYPDMQVVGESDGGPGVLERCAELNPDIALLDIKLQTGDGLSLCRAFRQANPAMHVVMLTSYDEETYLLEALRSGAHGYLLKSSSPEILVDTLRAVQAGERRISSSLMTAALRGLEQAQSERNLSSDLGSEEMQILRLLAQGAANREIAARMFMSERTVKRKLQDLLEKMGAATRAQAVAEGYKRGYL